MKTNHAFLISIRPRFAEMIFSGSKTVELRRVCPKVSVGDLALVYVSSPAMELRGSFEVGKNAHCFTLGTLEESWPEVRRYAC